MGVSKSEDNVVQVFKIDPDKASTCKALLRALCCGKLKEHCCLKENLIERLYRKGRRKVDKDVNLIEIIRNQKVFMAALTKAMSATKFSEVAVEYYYGFVTSGDDTKIDSIYGRRQSKARTLEEIEAQAQAVELKEYPMSMSTIINLQKESQKVMSIKKIKTLKSLSHEK